jgi:hypothetical protein
MELFIFARFHAHEGNECSESEIRITLGQGTGRISDSKLHSQLIVSRVVFEFEVPTARVPSM